MGDNLDPGTASYLSIKRRNSHGQGATAEIERGNNLKTKTQLQYKARRVFVNSDFIIL